MSTEAGGEACNIKTVILRKDFFVADKDSFNKNGFLVVQDNEWSDFKLYKAPEEASQPNTEEAIIVANVRGDTNYGTRYYCGHDSIQKAETEHSNRPLDKESHPVEIPLKKGKAGEEAYISTSSEIFVGANNCKALI